jgi:hypothetical protein
MDPEFVQNLRYKLQRRVRRLNSVSSSMFPNALRQFWVFFDSSPTLVGIADLLAAQYPELNQDVDRIYKGEGLVGGTEEESAALGYGVLRRLATESSSRVTTLSLTSYHGPSNSSEALEFIRDLFLEPFYDYIDEQLDDQRAMLALLMRYKQRCEWFHRERLWVLSQVERKGEKSLALDLYAYLHDQGIDFIIEPSSITGEIDLIAAQHTDDPLLLDTKIFDGEGRGKPYLLKGFNQIYTYTQQFNEPFGYLVIYKTTPKDLRFSLRQPSRNVPLVVHNHKTIFLLTIDIYHYEEPVSKRLPLQAIEITEEELVQIVEESSTKAELSQEAQQVRANEAESTEANSLQ